MRLRLGGLIAAFFLVSSASALALPSSTADAPTSDTNDRVRAVVQTAGRIFIGGDFTEVDGTTKRFVAALNANGNFNTAWRARTNGRVYALALSANGSRLFIGGRFTNVNGGVRKNMAAVRTSTGALVRSWRAGTDAAVRTIARRRGVLYLGGDFKTIRGKHRVRLAAVNAERGGVRRWRPLANRAVRSLAVRGTRVFAGGDFTKVANPGGNLFGRDHFAAINTRTGRIGAFNPKPGFPVNAVRTAKRRVYIGTGGDCDAGNCNAVLAFATSNDNTPLWRCKGDGDVHSLARSGGVIYVGGHWTSNAGECLNLRELMAINRSTGVPTGWNPRPNGFGVFALSAWQGTRLAVGGQFTRVSTVEHRNYAQFTGNLTSP
jgi:hypothetical protein